MRLYLTQLAQYLSLLDAFWKKKNTLTLFGNPFIISGLSLVYNQNLYYLPRVRTELISKLEKKNQ